MNILVIKQTSLGDVLHATPQLRAIKDRYPEAQLTVLTAQGSAGIYTDNPYIDRLVLFDYVRFKQLGLRSPIALRALFKATIAEVNHCEYELAFDLQGLARSVVFLYAARAKQKFVKGNWPGLGGFRNKQLHAIDEMSRVLAVADIPVASRQMDFFRSPEVVDGLRSKLKALKLDDVLSADNDTGTIIISPFTRWASKNWPLQRFIQAAVLLSKTRRVLITGTAQDRGEIQSALSASDDDTSAVVNLAGELSLPELAELMSGATLVISGDSFPMHLAAAVGAPLITLFGPTDEHKTGPLTKNSRVLRPDDCNKCDNPRCTRACLGQISVQRVISEANAALGLDQR